MPQVKIAQKDKNGKGVSIAHYLAESSGSRMLKEFIVVISRSRALADGCLIRQRGHHTPATRALSGGSRLEPVTTGPPDEETPAPASNPGL
jgi:hypothetical protein